ncbi:MAG: 4Fe-4S binding protein [Turneriella sp.]
MGCDDGFCRGAGADIFFRKALVLFMGVAAALANTMGDPFNNSRGKSERAWFIERITIYSILVITVVMTALIFVNEFRGVHDGFAEWVFGMKRWYGFFISAGFAGVIGTGFYPLMGTRVWCRPPALPQAAILVFYRLFFPGSESKRTAASVLRAATARRTLRNGYRCTQLAVRGEDIKRASCVGCGLCMSVCPRGVLD